MCVCIWLCVQYSTEDKLLVWKSSVYFVWRIWLFIIIIVNRLLTFSAIPAISISFPYHRLPPFPFPFEIPFHNPKHDSKQHSKKSAESLKFLRVLGKQFPSLILILKMCGIICYFTNPDCNIHVAGPINTALTMLQHRGQGPFFWLNLICRCLRNHDVWRRTDYYGQGQRFGFWVVYSAF